MRKSEALLLSVLSLILIVRNAAAGCSDVKPTHWAAEAVERTMPYLECRFNGERLLTRTEGAEIVSRVLESRNIKVSTASVKQELRDIPPGEPARDAIMRALAFRAMTARDESGKPGGTMFRGTENLTRFEMSLIVKRLVESKEPKEAKGPKEPNAPPRVPIKFTDVPADHWALEAVQGAVDSGVLQGWEGRFNGDKQITRYQAAVIVMKILEAPVSTGTVSGNGR